MPFTRGHYDREDLPFYYALADAFTICDQHFCSSLTGTTPNRLHLWTGTVRGKLEAASVPNVRNSEVPYDAPARWKTSPERLEEAGVSWRIYQTEVSVPSGLEDESDAVAATLITFHSLLCRNRGNAEAGKLSPELDATVEYLPLSRISGGMLGRMRAAARWGWGFACRC